jgi:hypothetical protein
VHRYTEYEKTFDLDENQSDIANFFTPQAGYNIKTGDCENEIGSNSYSHRHPRQAAITNALINDLIVGCSLPLSLVENDHFRHFLHVIDSRYTPAARATLSTSLERTATVLKEKLKEELKHTNTVNVTIDIWSDRKMRGYMATTVHYVSVSRLSTTSANLKDKQLCNIKSGLLAIERFTGSHTGEKIAAHFEAVLESYELRDKIDYIVTDNAANMRKAFTVCFPKFDETTAADPSDNGETETVDDVDDPETWEQLPDNEMTSVNNIIDATCRKERLSCFCHSLHLTVSDGLSDTKCVSTAIAKSSKLSSLLHKSSSFKDSFEKHFGKNKGIPATVNTRWNSTLRQIQAIVSLDQQELTTMLENDGHRNLIFTPREWAQLTELCDILEPFAEATNITQGNKTATISNVLPATLSLRTHLLEWKNKAKYCQPVVKALLSSLQTRFSGMFNKATPPRCRTLIPNHPNDDKFGSDIYFIATILDPKFRLCWLNVDVQGSAREKNDLKQEVIGMYMIILGYVKSQLHLQTFIIILLSKS